MDLRSGSFPSFLSVARKERDSFDSSSSSSSSSSLALQPPSEVVFYSPVAGFSLLAGEVS